MSEQARFVIIGGTSGVGLATAAAACARGGKVVIAGRDPQKLATALDQLQAHAVEAGAVSGEAVDAGDPLAMAAFMARVGAFDHLILAASGGKGAGPFAAVAEADLRQGFDAKFWVHWHAARAALPYLAERGSITFVTAASARMAAPGTSGLAAINAAITGMAAVLARELAPRRVNTISPGVIDTAWWDQQVPAMKEAVFAGASVGAPVGRVGQAAEVAEAILALALNGFITGALLDIDGGLRLGAPA